MSCSASNAATLQPAATAPVFYFREELVWAARWPPELCHCDLIRVPRLGCCEAWPTSEPCEPQAFHVYVIDKLSACRGEGQQGADQGAEVSHIQGVPPGAHAVAPPPPHAAIGPSKRSRP